MKENKRRPVNYSVLATGIALLLSACGGGSSGDSAGAAPAATLSDNQKNYESAALAANGGLHYLTGNLALATASNGAVTVGSNSVF
ncbi:hypothetical protein AAGS40_10290 [Paraburkholderia sp. PREW-6R]|uniref:hypothetical protein n=1 Tax=Paraburkholderia sp. PREW-6R TaxID=3141544 RepID=UPI0031F5B562